MNAASVKAIPLRRPAFSRRVLFTLAVVFVLAAAAAVSLRMRTNAVPAYVTAAVARGNLVQSVTASGTVNAQNTVSVGTQVSGTIQSIYVDFNSRVHTGQVLAQIDPSQFRAQVNQAQASLAQARAQASAGAQNARANGYAVQAANAAVSSAAAAVSRAQSSLVLARRTLERDRELLARGYIAQSQYDADDAALAAASAALRSSQAGTSQNAAQMLQASAGAAASLSAAQGAGSAAQAAQATLEQDALNLQRTTILSPVDGTIVARNVSVGQTVAASFQTPTLFTIAQDLRKMEVDIAVGEPDIGNVRPGETVTFTVLAYPNRTFSGRVSQVRVNPTTIANVVTYTVVVLVGNTDNALLPGMTANASIAVARANNALIVPLQALSYRPPSGTTVQHARQGTQSTPWGATASDVSGAVVAGSEGRVFVLEAKRLRRVRVHIDLVSGTQAAVTPLQTLAAGDAVVVGDDRTAATQRSASNPAFGMGRVIR